MKNFKKVISIILAIMMVITIVPLTASAATSGTCGDSLTWSYDESTYTLTISGTGAMDNYSSNNRPWEEFTGWSEFSDYHTIKKVVIESGVASISEYAFSCFYYLTDVTIANTVKFIGAYAFNECYNLKTINIPNSIKLIGDYAFNNCNRLTNITIPNSIISIGYDAFADCESLTEVNINDLSNWCNINFNALTSNPLYCKGGILKLNGDVVANLEIPNNVSEIKKYAFYNCDSIISVTIPNSVTSIGDYAFTLCDNLASTVIGKGVTSIKNYAFENCVNLESIIIPSNVKSIGKKTFYNCKKLNNVDLNDGLISIGEQAFAECSSLEKIILPDSVTHINIFAFENCTNLKSVHIGKSVSNMHYLGYDGNYYYTFLGCTSLENISVDKENQVYSSDEYGVLFNKEKTILYYYPAGNSRTAYSIPNTTIELCCYSFQDAINLSSINIPDSVEILGNNFKYKYDSFERGCVFINCIKLCSIIIPKKVSKIYENTFSGCTSLETVTLSNGVKSIYNDAFRNCIELSDIYYLDTEENWNNININNHNEWLLIANKHFEKEHSHNYVCENYSDSYYGETVGSPSSQCTKMAYCICGESQKQYNHNWNEWYPTLCGRESRRCKNCNTYEYRDTENATHEWHEWHEYSCGYRSRQCYICGQVETDNIENAEHIWTNWYGISGECGGKGQECRECQACYKQEWREVDAIEHYYYTQKVSGTCGGIVKYRKNCHNCNFVEYYEVEQEHNYYEYDRIESTCDKDGYVSFECRNCGGGSQTPIPATGHNYTWYTISVATCETDGVMLGECSACEDIDIKATPKTNHNYVNGICVNCTGNNLGGSTNPTCTIHSYTWKTVVEASCTQEGVCIGTCSVCEDTVIDYHDATGHNMNNGACENCDYTENVGNEDDNNNNENNNEVIDPSDDCGCNCHKSGISNFFFKFALFFQKLFGSNKECACGIAHY